MAGNFRHFSQVSPCTARACWSAGPNTWHAKPVWTPYFEDCFGPGGTCRFRDRFFCKSTAKLQYMPFSRPSGPTGNDAQKLYAQQPLRVFAARRTSMKFCARYPSNCPLPARKDCAIMLIIGVSFARARKGSFVMRPSSRVFRWTLRRSEYPVPLRVRLMRRQWARGDARRDRGFTPPPTVRRCRR